MRLFESIIKIKIKNMNLEKELELNSKITKLELKLKDFQYKEKIENNKKRVTKSITVINNTTDKEYVFESENEFGLVTSFNVSGEVFSIFQCTNYKYDKYDYMAYGEFIHVAHFSFNNFSIIYKLTDKL